MHFVLGKCDYQFRRGNTTRSLEYAAVAYNVAFELNLLEFTEHAHNRCVFLQTKTPILIDDVSEEEFTSILFGENSDIQTDWSGGMRISIVLPLSPHRSNKIASRQRAYPNPNGPSFPPSL
jgi:predicted NAD-dependent protein-ADP-ribosyltransferase YbiA (DUF1768 family)